MDARKRQENRGKKEINDVTDIIEKDKFPVKPNVRKKGEKIDCYIKKKKNKKDKKLELALRNITVVVFINMLSFILDLSST